MQKKLIALAIAGFAAVPAFAQSNVTVYGIADVYYGNATATGKNSQTAINSGGLSGSRLGFKGVEDLGNGLKAVFTLEYGLDIDSKTNGLGNPAVGSTTPARQQFVGLAGGFGTVVAGALQTAGYDFACAYNPLGGSALDSVAKVGVATLVACGGAGRASNAAAYISPNLSGWTLAANHARVTESSNTSATGNDSYANLLSAAYSNGPLAGGVVYSKISAKATVADDDVTEWGLGGSYKFSAATLFATYQTNKVGSASRDNKYQLAGAIPVSAAGTVVLQYAANKIKSTAASDDSKSYTVAYTHGLSKRTTLYTGYTHVSNDSAAAAAALIAPTAGGSSSVFAAGVRHSF